MFIVYYSYNIYIVDLWTTHVVQNRTRIVVYILSELLTIFFSSHYNIMFLKAESDDALETVNNKGLN